METWKHGNIETWKHGNMETLKPGNLETWKPGINGNMETWKNTDTGFRFKDLSTFLMKKYGCHIV